jgi:HD superfamily phosphohydrolase
MSYGQFDADWLVGNLSHEFKKGHCYLALQHRALYAFEDFLISRFHMFLMVYFHYKSVVFDAMLAEYLHSPENEYSLSPQIDRYLESNDAELYAHLAQSKNPWAKRIARREPYRMMIELHSGIPATQTATKEQAQLLTRVKKQLHDQKTHFIEATSTGELSKYFRKPAAPIFVKYDNHYSAPSSIPLDKCTDLFTRYSEKRSITRLYVAPESFKQIRLQGRGAPLRYEEDPSSPQTTLF